ncbi:hypothetical protein [Ornithinimicrobium pekingense]|uniref:Major facilitator superfamily (MFS) profile domain-containing protein n=1 Tax=Ornithinimicrobium pekingense TaxID=384677 RepID=A0ABQ2F5P2_9MICO|nr:hypothetical protein [Ornithinimicrobium pekingense]GGK64657.1 hypothetical protein GCM10011509_11190 [Ornithinimicrobium pekingense]
MRLDWRYLVLCLLVGVAVCSVVAAVGGVLRALLADSGASGGPGAVAGTVVASAVAGLLIGAALGCLLGAVSGVVATVLAGGRDDPRQVAVRVGLGVAATYLVALTVVAGLAGGPGWQLPSALSWVGVLAPTVLAALVSARAAREVPTL